MKITFRRVRVIHLSQTRRWSAVFICLIGGGCFLAGQVLADQEHDRRFYFLAATGSVLMAGAYAMADRNRRRI